MKITKTQILTNENNKTGARNKELVIKGVSGANVIIDPCILGYTIQISIWNQYQPAESRRFEDVAFNLADEIWKEARYIYRN